jgi:predicted nucleic acid-binding protein
LARDPTWAAPLVWRSEFRNSLAGLIRQRALSLEDAVLIAREAELRMTGHEYGVVTHRVLDLAARSGCTAYDCEFVAVAQDLGVDLVTSDQQMLAAFPSTAVAIDSFARAAAE